MLTANRLPSMQPIVLAHLLPLLVRTRNALKPSDSYMQAQGAAHSYYGSATWSGVAAERGDTPNTFTTQEKRVPGNGQSLNFDD